jgi:hypothetical protein
VNFRAATFCYATLSKILDSTVGTAFVFWSAVCRSDCANPNPTGSTITVSGNDSNADIFYNYGKIEIYTYGTLTNEGWGVILGNQNGSTLTNDGASLYNQNGASLVNAKANLINQNGA